jgi:hypothetical protein
MHWITSTVLAVMALAGVTAHAMTGGASLLGFAAHGYLRQPPAHRHSSW